MERYNWSKTDKIVTVFLIACLFITWVGVLSKGSVATNYRSKTRTVQQRIFVLQNSIDAQQRELNYKYERSAVNSPNKTIRESTQQIIAERKVSQVAPKLFKVLYTYSSHSQYVSRGRRAASYVTPELRSNPHIFPKNDDDGTGHSYIKSAGLKIRYLNVQTSIGVVSGEEVPVIAKVVANGSIARGDQRLDTGQVQQLYTGTFNIKKNKFTDLNNLNRLSTTAIQN